MVQSVSSAFTAEEKDPVRRIAHSLLASWKKETNLGNRTFTIGVSSIGGNDIIGLNVDGIGGAGVYKYSDESDYVQRMAWERSFNMPTGGMTKALAEADLDNTSGRFTPRHMGGSGELFTSIKPRRPIIINAGFEIGGSDQMVPQFAGIIDKQPRVDFRSRQMRIQAADYIDFFANRKLDQSVMFTGLRTDQAIENLFLQLGMATAQFELDSGINTIPFGIFERGAQFSDVIHKLVEAENGQLFQDEEGIFRFFNRQHYDMPPYNVVQRIIRTAQVIDAEVPTEDHIVNVVEVRSKIRSKQPEQIVFNLNAFDAIQIPANSTKEVFVDYEDPVLSVTTPVGGGTNSYFVANSAEDGSGSDTTSDISLDRIDNFAKASKIIFRNNSVSTAYLTTLVITGRPAKVERDLYFREQDGSSVTAYEERPLSIDNDYIQSESWAQSYAQLILNQYSEPEQIQRITIRAIPELQNGDLVSWQGKSWRVFGIRAQVDPSVGFVQELTMLIDTAQTYFRIGISSIGGADRIAA